MRTNIWPLLFDAGLCPKNAAKRTGCIVNIASLGVKPAMPGRSIPPPQGRTDRHDKSLAMEVSSRNIRGAARDSSTPARSKDPYLDELKKRIPRTDRSRGWSRVRFPFVF